MLSSVEIKNLSAKLTVHSHEALLAMADFC